MWEPHRPRAGERDDVSVVVGSDRLAGRVEHARPVFVELPETDGEELHDLARVVLKEGGISLKLRGVRLGGMGLRRLSVRRRWRGAGVSAVARRWGGGGGAAMAARLIGEG